MEGFGLLRRFFCALLALTLCILFAAPARGEGVYDFIRLHVVASGDTDWEQAVKLAVRDACLEKAREVAAGVRGRGRGLRRPQRPSCRISDRRRHRGAGDGL